VLGYVMWCVQSPLRSESRPVKLNFTCVASLFSMSTYTTQGLGLTQSNGSIVQAALAAGQMVSQALYLISMVSILTHSDQVGRPVLGLVMDKLGRVNVAFGASFIAGVWSF
jgi:hypothetical protein